MNFNNYPSNFLNVGIPEIDGARILWQYKLPRLKKLLWFFKITWWIYLVILAIPFIVQPFSPAFLRFMAGSLAISFIIASIAILASKTPVFFVTDKYIVKYDAQKFFWLDYSEIKKIKLVRNLLNRDSGSIKFHSNAPDGIPSSYYTFYEIDNIDSVYALIEQNIRKKS